jgi:hypothetical protein
MLFIYCTYFIIITQVIFWAAWSGSIRESDLSKYENHRPVLLHIRIHWIAQHFYPEIGGMENHIRKIAKRPIKKSHEVTVHTSLRTTDNGRLSRNGWKLKKENEKIKKYKRWRKLLTFSLCFYGFYSWCLSYLRSISTQSESIPGTRDCCADG